MKIIRNRGSRIVPEEMDILCHWIMEREALRIRKAEGGPPPWTTDALLEHYRWCNVRRMDDKVSVWILAWHKAHPEFNIRDRVIAATAGRLINWPETLETLPYPIPYRFENWQDKLLRRKMRGEKVFTGAYIVNGALGGDKIIQVCELILQPMWDNRKIFPDRGTHMAEFAGILSEQIGIGPFIAGQAVADLRHIHDEYDWPDRFTWAPQGPGSIRGVNRLIGLEAKRAKGPRPSEWLDIVCQGYAMAAQRLPTIFRRLELMDFQNCLCEYDKYSRLTKNEGSVRARYDSKEAFAAAQRAKEHKRALAGGR